MMCCMFTGKLKLVDNDTSTDQEVESALAADNVRADIDTSTDQEVESPDNVRANTPSDLGIACGSGLGLVRISEVSPYTEETPPPYESIVLAVDSLPSNYDALAMSSPIGHMSVLLPAPSANGVVPRQFPMVPISTNHTTSGPVPTDLTN